MFKHNNLTPRYKVFEITKIAEKKLIVPALGTNHHHNLKRGIYEWVHQGNTIKYGLFGEGVDSNASSRYSVYRSSGKHLSKYLENPKKNTKKGNGSVKPMTVLDEILKVGESVSVYFYEVINPTIEVDGVRYDINLATIEKEAKSTKETLLLN